MSDARSSSEPIAIGSTIGEKYRVVRLLGQGGMGAVYEAENTWTTRRVAVKVLQPDIASDEEAVGRFKQEAQAATRLAHPNIVDVLDMGADRATGALYIVQEFLTGSDLFKRMESRTPMSPAEAFDILVPLMGALVAAHSRGIVHRDIKPENIFLTVDASGETVPKLIDFGISKVMEPEEGLRKTKTGVVMGTPYYMSPEQVRGLRDVDARSDVWAVGAVLYEMLAAQCPFDAPNYNLLMFKILTDPPARIETLVLALPTDVAEIVHRALEPDRDKRYPSMQAFLDAVLGSPTASNVPPERSLRVRHRRSITVVNGATDEPTTASLAPPAAADERAAAAGEPTAADALARTASPSVPHEAPEPAPAQDQPPPPPEVATLARATPFGWNRPSGAHERARSRARTYSAFVALAVALAASGAFFARRTRTAPSGASPTTAPVTSAAPTTVVSPPPDPTPLTPVAPPPLPAALPVAAPSPAPPLPEADDQRAHRGAGRHRRQREPAAANAPTAPPAAPQGTRDLLVPVGEH